MASSLIARARRARPSAHPSSGALRAGPLPAPALEPEPLTRRLRASQSLWTILWASCAKPVGILWITCGKPVDSRDPRHPPCGKSARVPFTFIPPFPSHFRKWVPLGPIPPPKKNRVPYGRWVPCGMFPPCPRRIPRPVVVRHSTRRCPIVCWFGSWRRWVGVTTRLPRGLAAVMRR
jgi:hypothetical protein